MDAALSIALLLLGFPLQMPCHRTTGTVLEFLPQYDLTYVKWTFKGAWSNQYKGYTMKCYETNEYSTARGHWSKVALVLHESRIDDPLGGFSVGTCDQAALCRSIIVKKFAPPNCHRIMVYDATTKCNVFSFEPPSTTVDSYRCSLLKRPSSTRGGDHGCFRITDKPPQPSQTARPAPAPQPADYAPPSKGEYTPVRSYRAEMEYRYEYSTSDRERMSASRTPAATPPQRAPDYTDQSPSQRDSSYHLETQPKYAFSGSGVPFEPRWVEQSSQQYTKPSSQDWVATTPRIISHSPDPSPTSTYQTQDPPYGQGPVILVYKTQAKYTVVNHDQTCC